MIKFIGVGFLVLCSCLVLDCKEKEADTQQKKSVQEQIHHTEKYGIVKEFINASSYTYILIQSDDKEIWMAVPTTSVTIGDTVLVPSDGTPMTNYHSKTLGRTFEKVLFAGSIVKKHERKQSGSPKTNPHRRSFTPPVSTGHDTKMKNPHAAVKPSAKVTGIKKVTGGQTIAEIYAQKEKLFGNKVLFRGKLVKANFNILGTNWYHLQDGTGSIGSNDITVTSKTEVTKGKIAVVEGILVKDRDFGAGYKYHVIIENADISVE